MGNKNSDSPVSKLSYSQIFISNYIKLSSVNFITPLNKIIYDKIKTLRKIFYFNEYMGWVGYINGVRVSPSLYCMISICFILGMSIVCC